MSFKDIKIGDTKNLRHWGFNINLNKKGNKILLAIEIDSENKTYTFYTYIEISRIK